MSVPDGPLEDLKNKLATVIVSAELALRLEGEAGREQVRRVLRAAWAADALFTSAADPVPTAEPVPAAVGQRFRVVA